MALIHIAYTNEGFLFFFVFMLKKVCLKSCKQSKSPQN